MLFLRKNFNLPHVFQFNSNITDTEKPTENSQPIHSSFDETPFSTQDTLLTVSNTPSSYETLPLTNGILICEFENGTITVREEQNDEIMKMLLENETITVRKEQDDEESQKDDEVTKMLSLRKRKHEDSDECDDSPSKRTAHE